MRKLIVIKQSKYEYEREKFNLSHDEIVKKYSKERANLDAILESHEKQLQVRNSILDIIPDSIICSMDDISQSIKEIDDKYDTIIISVGGDNLFTYVTHSADCIPILGVNSDPERSVGCLTRWAIHNNKDVYDMVEMLDFGEFDIVNWTRLSATIDGKIITPATSEYFFGERLRNDMSRHVIVYKGMEYEQKCSGVIFATGAGSTGWYKSATRVIRKKIWSAEEEKAHFVITEPYNSPVMYGEIEGDEEVIIYSLNDGDGIASVDSWETFPFTRGSKAKISLGEPLNIIIPRKNQNG